MKKRTIYTPNEIIIKGEIAEIILYNRNCKEKARAIIDAEDVEKVEKYKWCLSHSYVATYIKKRALKIQHVILGIKSNKAIRIDHVDRNPLNNRKENIRPCTHRQNIRNSGKRKNNTSGYKGVWKNGEKWCAEITVNGKKVYLGIFGDKAEAARIYNEASLKYHKEFACLNSI